jgi:hypothetical protein
MMKLDRLVWAAGFSGTCFSMRIGIRANNPQVLEMLHPLLPTGWSYTSNPVVDWMMSYIDGGAPTRPGIKRFHILYLGPSRVARSLEQKEILDAFRRHLKQAVTLAAPKYAFVEAGVVGWRGRAIVLPGCSDSGKTMLTAALVRAGATYYSDRFAVFHENGKVHPFAEPLELLKADGKPGKKVTAEDLGGQTGTKPLPVGLVVDTKYRKGCCWRPRRGTVGHSALALTAHAVPMLVRPEWTLRMLSRAVQGSTHIKGARGEADEVAERILHECADW